MLVKIDTTYIIVISSINNSSTSKVQENAEENFMKTLEMKKCKECGKLFMPTSNKQKYCSGPHFRPCPVCGKLVFAKYLSDPARCCSGVCKSKLGKLNKEDVHVAEVMQQKVDLEIEIPKIESIEVLEPTPQVVAYAEADAKAVEAVYKVHQALDGTTRKRFVGLSTDGWNEGHEYAVVIAQEGKEHVVHATYDYTDGKVVDLRYVFTNKKKITSIFKAVR